MRRLRTLARAALSRILRDRPLPVGGTARHRRLLEAALPGRAVGDVLVVGHALAVRQALPDVDVDVADALPFPEVTVCSAADQSGSLPPARWDLVVVSDPGPDLTGRLRAVLPACRPGGTVLLVDGAGWTRGAAPEAALLQLAAEAVVVRGRHRVLAVGVPR